MNKIYQSRGFTLMEILTVVVVIGILAGLGIPQYQKTIAKARSAEASTNLKTLHMAQKIYRIDEGAFFGDATATLAEINEGLSIELEEEYYDISIVGTSTANSYTARATRKDGASNAFGQFEINQDGQVCADTCS